jgi:hypothetical protein
MLHCEVIMRSKTITYCLLAFLFCVLFLTGCESPNIEMDLDTDYQHEGVDAVPTVEINDIEVDLDNTPPVVTSQDLRAYMETYNSPLADYADLMIEACRAHDCDPCLIVAIGLAESTLGKNMGGDYNFWGFIKDGKVHSFQSMENSIWALAYEFGENGQHRNKRSLEAINNERPPFCASGCEHWLSNVEAAYNAIPGCHLDTDLTFPD